MRLIGVDVRVNDMVRSAIGVLVLVMPFSCPATDTLDCLGKPYSVMMHVGSNEDGQDFLADLMLHKEGDAEPVHIYFHKDISVALFKWSGHGRDNALNLSSKPGVNVPFELIAGNAHDFIKVYGKEFSIKCHWER